MVNLHVVVEREWSSVKRCIDIGLRIIASGRNDLWEELTLDTTKGVTASDEANHLLRCESLAREGGDVLLKGLLWLGDASIVRLRCVHPAATISNPWASARILVSTGDYLGEETKDTYHISTAATAPSANASATITCSVNGIST
jgi:hypothetical protein